MSDPGIYFAAKAYVISFSNAIAEELPDTNVTVTTLLPGAMETEFGRISGTKQKCLKGRPIPEEWLRTAIPAWKQEN